VLGASHDHPVLTALFENNVLFLGNHASAALQTLETKFVRGDICCDPQNVRVLQTQTLVTKLFFSLSRASAALQSSASDMGCSPSVVEHRILTFTDEQTTNKTIRNI